MENSENCKLSPISKKTKKNNKSLMICEAGTAKHILYLYKNLTIQKDNEIHQLPEN